MPVADLVGLRFSVVHLRLGGYSLIAIWASEIVGLLTLPLLWAIGPRLHYISQALDLSPLLVVGIILIAFQGGLQRHPVERLFLPLLFGLLPLLAAVHFLMAPASIANAITLSFKQEQVNKDQLTSIEGQLDRAGQVVLDSQDLEDLRRRLDAIPGVRLSANPDVTLQQARQEVTAALLIERQRVRSRLGSNAAQARSQFVRRAVMNAGLATLMGVMLSWMRNGALREMELSSTYLNWLAVADPDVHNLGGVKDLADFQKRCLATSYLELIRRLTQNQDEESEIEQESQESAATPLESAPQDSLLPPPPAPWESITVRSEEWRRKAGIFRGRPVIEPLFPFDPSDDKHLSGSKLTPRQLRRRAKEREKIRAALEDFSRMTADYDADYDSAIPDVRPVRDFGSLLRRPSQRQLNRYRKFMNELVHELQQNQAADFPDPSEQGKTDPSVGESTQIWTPQSSFQDILRLQQDIQRFVGILPTDPKNSQDDSQGNSQDDSQGNSQDNSQDNLGDDRAR
jgi:hypothetical protein